MFDGTDVQDDAEGSFTVDKDGTASANRALADSDIPPDRGAMDITVWNEVNPV